MDLCARYASGANCQEAAGATILEQVAASVGVRLSSSGTAGVPAEDVAKLALLLARRGEGPQRPAAAKASVSPAAPGQGQPAAPPVETEIGDLGKGEEGFRQGIEQLRELPPSERFVITGDITSGLQAATVAGGPDLTSMFGRVRMNAVARVVPASPGGMLSEGHFFIQMQAAGGPFNSVAVGGSGSFSALNDVATRRSRFNEGRSRGNLYLGKTFYQQELRLGENRVTGRIGVIDISDFFDTNTFANNESRQYLNSALVNSTAYKAGFSAPGLMGEYRRKMPYDWLDGAVLRVGYTVSRTERAFTSPLWTLEGEATTLTRGRRGHWRVGGTLGHVADAGGVRGMHISADQWISRRMGVFGRYAFGGRGPGSLAISPVSQSYSGGVHWRLVDRDDNISAVGIGFSQSFPIDPDGLQASERVLETYYRWQIAENLSLTPDFQIVLGSGGARSHGTHVVMGLRMFFGL
jgi:hypothetical protein